MKEFGQSATVFCLVLLGSITLKITTAVSENDLNQVNDKTLLQELVASSEITYSIREPYRSTSDVTLSFPDGLTIPADRGILESLYSYLVATNPYGKVTANVRTFNQPTMLGDQENLFLEKRDSRTHQALEKLLNRPLGADENIRIALCGSGGGYRALLSFEGLLEGLDITGILDAVTYITALSGSTWAVAPWLLTDKRYSDFGPLLRQRVTQGLLGRDILQQLKELEQHLSSIANCFLRPLAFGLRPSLIDFYGLMIGLSLFDEQQKSAYFSLELAHQIPFIHEGQNPLPLYTAVIAHKTMGPYSWLEFSPYEVSCPELGWAVPSWAFGRKFAQNVSTNNAPPLPLGFLMGIWGSAISFSIGEAFSHTIGKLRPHELFNSLQSILNSTQIGNIRFFPVVLPNPLYKTSLDISEVEKKQLTIIDAGFDQNLPIVPLLNPERHIDLIIICDSSGDITTLKSLKDAEAYAQKHTIPFPPIDYDKALSQPFTLFDGGPKSKAPMILYFPLVKNTHYSATFNPHDSLGIGFLNTTNFAYKQGQANLVSNLFSYSAQEARETLLALIEIILHRKKILLHPMING